MKYKLLLLTATPLFLLHLSARSQNDSTRLDVGGVVLKRAFTQNVTIRGEDLEKMPFTDLTEALRPWLYGTYTDAGHITYVVDGNVLSDVNSLSVHDIEEVVLVQHAAAVSTAGTQQQLMVLVTTQKGKDRSGLQGDAQTFLIHGSNTDNRLFHQYNVSGYKNLDKISMGFSAGYLRDVSPIYKGVFTSATPAHLDRWRVNGYFVWRPDSKNTIEAHVGLASQSTGSEIIWGSGAPAVSNVSNKAHLPTKLLLPWIRWRSEWATGLTNDLQAGLVSEQQKGYSWQFATLVDINGNNEYLNTDILQHTDHQYIRDRISYEAKAGDWRITPSLNAAFEHFRDIYFQSILYAKGPGVSPGNIPIGTSSYGTQQSGPFWAKIYLLTPAIDFTYKELLDIQGGAVVNVSHAPAGSKDVKRVFPFASAALELLRKNGDVHNNSLKLFGSYAQRDALMFNDFTLGGMSSAISVDVNQVPLEFYTGTTPVIPQVTPNAVKTYWTWQTGASFASRDDRWQVSYHFERLNFTMFSVVQTPLGPNFFYPEWKSSLHYLGLRGRIIDGANASWQSGLTAVLIRNKSDKYGDNYNGTPLGSYIQGDNKASWTGGWTNRFRYKEFSLGVDMVYHFNREVVLTNSSGGLTYTNANNFLLQNIYLAYRMRLAGKTGLEIYVDSKGLVRKDNYHYLDSRRYYGVGGKITI